MYEGDRSGQAETAVGRRNDAVQFFVDLAFFFLACKEQILSDSRLFLAPVPIRNELAYMGQSGLEHPTLGTYIEWWFHHLEFHRLDHQGTLSHIYQFAGSPLSGKNICWTIDEQGRIRRESRSSFQQMWSSFQQINRRYAEASCQYESYTLEQAYQFLRKPELS